MLKTLIRINTLGIKFRRPMTGNSLFQLEVDRVTYVCCAFISKVENNEKPINRKHLSTLRYFFYVPEVELHTLWLADKVRLILDGEPFALSEMKMMNKALDRNESY